MDGIAVSGSEDTERLVAHHDPVGSLHRAGWVVLAGVATMVVGAVRYFTAGADLWEAVDGGEMSSFLADIEGASGGLYTALSIWIAGAVFLAVGGVMAARQGSGVVDPAAAVFITGGAVAVVGMVTMAASVRAATGGAGGELVDALAFAGIRLDDLATVLLIGMGPGLCSLWCWWAPGWLRRWGGLAAVAGVISLISIFSGNASTWGFVVVPVGMGWMLAAGIVLARLAQPLPQTHRASSSDR